MAGIANACLVPALITSSGQPAQSAGNSASAPHCDAVDASATALAGFQVGDEPHGKANCLDFCDQASVSIPPSKAAPDQVQYPALAMPALPVALAVDAVVRVRQQVPPGIERAGRSIPIAFLRLAL